MHSHIDSNMHTFMDSYNIYSNLESEWNHKWVHVLFLNGFIHGFTHGFRMYSLAQSDNMDFERIQNEFMHGLIHGSRMVSQWIQTRTPNGFIIISYMASYPGS